MIRRSPVLQVRVAVRVAVPHESMTTRRMSTSITREEVIATTTATGTASISRIAEEIKELHSVTEETTETGTVSSITGSAVERGRTGISAMTTRRSGQGTRVRWVIGGRTHLTSRQVKSCVVSYVIRPNTCQVTVNTELHLLLCCNRYCRTRTSL